MTGNIHHIELENEYLRLYFNIADIPNTPYIKQYMLTLLNVRCSGDLIEFMKIYTTDGHLLPILFESRSDCTELLNMVRDGDITYTLKEARTIIQWINESIYYDGDGDGDGEDWFPYIMEILENARI